MGRCDMVGLNKRRSSASNSVTLLPSFDLVSLWINDSIDVMFVLPLYLLDC